MKPGDTIEGPEAQRRFTTTMKHILSIPKEEMKRREAEYQAQSALKPKRGPKPKTTASAASPAPPA